MIFLAQKDESVELLKSEKRIHCDPGMERALKSLTTADGRYAELVLHGPDGWRVARLVLDRWSVALFSSRGPAFTAVETLKAEGLSTVEAIDRLAGDAPLAGVETEHSETAEHGRSRMTRKQENEERPLNWPDDPETSPLPISTSRRWRTCWPTPAGGAAAAGSTTRSRRTLWWSSEEIEALDGLGEEDRRVLALHALLRDAPSAWLRAGHPESQRAVERAGRLASGIEAAVREAAGLDAVLEEEPAELLRFVTRMAAAADRAPATCWRGMRPRAPASPSRR